MRSIWPDARRLLVIRLDASGDVLMCTPALHALSSSGHEISLLTSSAGALVGTRCESVSRVVIFDSPWMKASAASAAEATQAIAKSLRSGAYEGAVIMHSYSQSPLPAAMLCHLAGIPRQLSYCRENPYQLISDWIPEQEPESLCRHEVQRQLDLVSVLCKPMTDISLHLRLTDENHIAAERALEQLGLYKGQDFLLIHPGASAASRRYPLASLQASIRQLGQEVKLPIVLAGGTQDQTMLSELLENSDSFCAGIASTLDFGGLAALIGKARLLIANNSAPAHLAAAMQTPVVVLYALTNPQHTPWQVPNKVICNPVPCAPCYRSVCPLAHHTCLAGVPPSKVVAAVTDLLAETGIYQDGHVLRHERMEKSQTLCNAAGTNALRRDSVQR